MRHLSVVRDVTPDPAPEPEPPAPVAAAVPTYYLRLAA